MSDDKAPVTEWSDVLRYDVESQLTMHPTKCWVVRRLTFRQPSMYTTLHGPFEGAMGAAAARTIANSLNSFTVGKGEDWGRLTREERDYILAGLTLPDRPGLDDDEIPF